MKGLASVGAEVSPASSEAKHYRDIVSFMQGLKLLQKFSRETICQTDKLNRRKHGSR